MNSKLLEIWKTIAESENTPASILEKLAQKLFLDDFIIETLRQLLPNSTSSLWESVKTFIKQHQSPELIRFWLRQDEAFRDPILQEWRQLLAGMTEADIKTLESIGRKVNINTNERQLIKKYPEIYSLYGILKRLGNPVEKNSNNRSIAVALVSHPNTPVEVREELQKQLTLPQDSTGDYPDWDMRFALAFNSAIPEERRAEYLQQVIVSGREARRQLAKHPKTPDRILEQLATTDAIDEVADNPHTAASILRQLAKQKNPYIRTRVSASNLV